MMNHQESRSSEEGKLNKAGAVAGLTLVAWPILGAGLLAWARLSGSSALDAQPSPKSSVNPEPTSALVLPAVPTLNTNKAQ